MVQYTKATGTTVWLSVKESSSILMGIFTRDIGLTIKQMEKEYISMPRVLDTKATGRMISNMASG